MIAVGMQITHHGEGDIAEEHQAEELGVMIPGEGEETYAARTFLVLILHHKTEAADEEEERHSVVAEEREDVHEEVVVERAQSVEQLHRFAAIERVFVFLHGKAEEMTIVVQYDSENRYASEGFRFGKGQKLLVHFLFLLFVFFLIDTCPDEFFLAAASFLAASSFSFRISSS